MGTDSRPSGGSDGTLVSHETPPSPQRRSDTRARSHKVRKITRACDACKAKKKACTGNIPCGPCMRRKVDCTYNTTYNRGAAVTPPPSGAFPEHNAPTPESRQITQETESNSATPFEPPGRRHSTDVADQYWGPTSAHSFLGWAVRDLPPTPSNVVTNTQDAGRASRASIFNFGDRAAPDVQLADFEWPDRQTAESLTRRYFDFACPTYRTLHQPTIEQKIHEIYGDQTYYDGHDYSNGESTAAYAILLMVFSTATMFRSGADGRIRDADEIGWTTSERYFAKAEQLLSQETGVPTLESAQARFLMVLYLISSSRANKAWFTLGTAIQLMMALGLHSRRSNQDNTGENLIQRECRRRTVWCSYTLDKYLSVILGRPRLWNDGDVDEELPARVNDVDLLPMQIESARRDCVMDAPVLHTILARILSQAAKEPYVVAGISNRDQLNIIRGFCESVADWQAGLPPLLSGAIHPSSLVPVFQRQLTVLQLARYHLLMFITRPLLLRNYGQIWPDCEASYFNYLGICLTAARDAIELVLSFVRENQLFHAFWYSQYIAFNALSIIYIYLIQVQRRRIVPISVTIGRTPNGTSLPPLEESTLYRLSETAQYHLADATVRNAPSWKYSAILQGLRRELERLGMRMPLVTANNSRESSARELFPPPVDNTLTPTAHPNYPHMRPPNQEPAEPQLGESSRSAVSFTGIPRLADTYFPDSRTEYLFDSFATDKDLMLDFWPQLDSLPISYLGN
ncbi:fungal-specific transcription factor domain-containing protein [Aspergillus heterothallicus]